MSPGALLANVPRTLEIFHWDPQKKAIAKKFCTTKGAQLLYPKNVPPFGGTGHTACMEIYKIVYRRINRIKIKDQIKK